MKIRSGFVSNSSSSSFMIMYNEITIDEALNYNGKFDVYILGDYIDEGRDVFKLTKEIAEIFKTRGSEIESNDGMRFVEAYKIFYDSGAFLKKDFENIPEKFQIDIFEVEQHSTDTAEDFINTYINGETY